MRKKKWGKPKLIILTKGKPEEGVLAACKNVTPTTSDTYYSQCEGVGGYDCGSCLSLIGS